MARMRGQPEARAQGPVWAPIRATGGLQGVGTPLPHMLQAFSVAHAGVRTAWASQ